MSRYPWIVIFGAAVRDDGAPSGVLRRRIEGGYSAWRRLPDAHFILSGAAADHRPSEASVMREILLAKGVPETAMVLDEASRDTMDSALAAWRILKARDDVGRVWVCTSAFHAPRCRLLLWLQGLPTGTVRIPPASTPRRQSKYLYWTLREIPALPWDALLMLIELCKRQRAGRQSPDRDGT